jgi:hypothetical protein
MTATGKESGSSASSSRGVALELAGPAAHPHEAPASLDVAAVPQHASFADGSQHVACAAGLQQALGSDIATLLSVVQLHR